MARPSNKIKLIISAQTKDAVKGIGNVSKGLVSLRQNAKRMRSGLSRTGILPAAMGFSGMGAAGAAAVKASFDFEYVKLRLEAVYGSARKAEQVFGEIFELFRKSPLMLEPLVKARILLASIGQTGMGALTAVANASTAMGKDIVEVAQAVASMELEPLRKMGVEIRRLGDSGVITFMDRMGQRIKVTGTTVDDLRVKLMQAFNLKFGGFLGKASKTGTGLYSTLVGSLKAVLAQAGDQFAGAVKKAMTKVNKALMSTLSTGMVGAIAEAWAKSVSVMVQDFKIAFEKGGVFGVLKLGLKKILAPFAELFAAAILDLGEGMKWAATLFGYHMDLAVTRTMKKFIGVFGKRGKAYADSIPFPIKPNRTDKNNVGEVLKGWVDSTGLTGNKRRIKEFLFVPEFGMKDVQVGDRRKKFLDFGERGGIKGTGARTVDNIPGQTKRVKMLPDGSLVVRGDLNMTDAAATMWVDKFIRKWKQDIGGFPARAQPF